MPDLDLRPLPDRCGELIGLSDEVGDEECLRVAIDLGRRTYLFDAALVHDDDAVGHGERLFLIVRDHDRGDAELALQLLDLVSQMHAHLGVERRQGLVEKQQARRDRHGAGKSHALLLSAG